MEWSNECKIIYNNITRNNKIDFERLLLNKKDSEIKGLLAEIESGTHSELRSELIMRLMENSQKLLYFKEKVEGAGIYTFSVMVRPLMEYDKAYFTDIIKNEGDKIVLNDHPSNRVIDILYKPYYYEAVMYTGDDREKQSMIEKRLEEAYKNGEKWIAIREDKEVAQENFHLRTYFSASPYRTEDLYVAWESAVVEDIEDIEDIFEEYQTKEFDYAGCPNGKETFEKLFTGVKKSRVDVLRVGEGSANYGKIENATGIHEYFFDVGLPIDSHCPEGEAEKHLHNKVEKYYTNNKVEAVILSHWHTDHIKGAFLLQNLDDIMWIAPPLVLSEIRSPSIQKLGCYLYSKNKLANVSVASDLIYSCDEFALYRGTSSIPKDLNNKCLMLQLCSTLLPGDCKFTCWPESFGVRPNYKYKHLVFPHHGAYVEFGEERIDCMENSADTLVIIPTGYNLYGQKDNRKSSHPAQNLKVFQGKDYTVFPTNPINNKNVGERLFPYYDENALSAEVNVQNTDLQIRKENSDFSLHDK